MGLDLHKTAPQIEAMAEGLQAEERARATRLRTALEQLASADPARLEERRRQGRFTWLTAKLAGELAERRPPPPAPQDYVSLAVDGSQIDVSRHSPARCYLINIGRVSLRYGDQPGARLESLPTLYAQDGELALADPLGTRDQPLEGPLLGIKRTVEEVRHLAALASESPQDIPVLALLDGSLILWGLAGQGYPDFVRKALLTEGFLPALDALREAAQRRPLAVASYISLPRATDVVGSLRLAVCPYETVNCDHHCGGLPNGRRPCDVVGGLTDRELLSQVLKPGERSALFYTTSSIVEEAYGDHGVAFFYLDVGQELARVEVPLWVARDEALLGLAHSLTLEQCRKGQGYPVALAEAHEQAVVTGRDREEFHALVEEALAGQRLPVYTSEKARSKRTRWV